MKAFIFDVDGTLIDSYKGIVKTTEKVLKNHNYSLNNIRDFILDKSVLDLFIYVSKELNIDSNILFKEYDVFREETKFDYTFMPNSIDTLKYLHEKGYKLFIYTHKGVSTHTIIESNNIDSLFTDVISSENINFKRKPNPYSLNYIIDNYDLDRKDTYYVGDRKIDLECAKNAQVKSIYFDNRNSNYPNYDIKINDFSELKKLF